MPLTPEQAAKRNDELYSSEFDKACKLVDEVLAKDYHTGYSSAISVNCGSMSSAVRERIIKAYRAAGWMVDWTSDQREGDYLQFKPALFKNADYRD